MKPTISKPFKSNDRTFEKVFGLFNKKDYFNVKGLAKTQIGNFERALQKNDKNAQQVLDMFKGDERKAKEYIIQVIHDRKKEQAFNDYKALKSAVDSIQKGKPGVGAVDYVKRIIHNNNQKYSIALYSAISGKKFNNYKDIHKDIDSSINEGQKRYNQKDGVGKSKYVISYHDGKKKHKDGSDFFDIQIFRNKKDLAKFVNTLHKGGYKYGFAESVNEGISVFDERHFGKKGIIIMIDDNGKKVSAIFKDKKNADKFNRNKPSDIKKLLQLAKKTKFPKAIDESVNEGSMDWEKHFKGYNEKELKVISKLIFMNSQGIDGVIKMSKKKDFKPFIKKAAQKGLGESVHEGKYNYKKDALTDYFRGKLSAKELDKIARDDFNSGIATKKELSSFLSNKFTQDVMSDTYGIPVNTLIKRVRGLMKFAEGVNEMDPHYPVVSSDDEEVAESKTQINQLKKKVGKKEIKFYDALSKLEKKMGSRYKSFLDKSLKDFKLNPSKFRTNGDKEEKLFQVSDINTNEDLRNWFKKKWVNIGKKDKSGKHPPCGTSGKKSGYAKCVPAAKAATMSKKEKESATRRKRAAQNKAGRGGSQGGGGRKPINVSTHTGGRKSGTGKGS